MKAINNLILLVAGNFTRRVRKLDLSVFVQRARGGGLRRCRLSASRSVAVKVFPKRARMETS